MEKNEYTKMQQQWYDWESELWTVDAREPVVGGFDMHNNWADYDEFLFKDIITEDKVMIDFACGPGRNIVKFWNKFKRIDGVDIAQTNLDNAKKWMLHNNITTENTLYKCNGTDLSGINDLTYDIVMSTIAMQHICSYDIRLNYFKEFYRILKPGGSITIQMGFGQEVPSKTSVGYYDNFYDASGTNGRCDTRVESPDQLKTDLTEIGFINFIHHLRPTGPGDGHPQWIFFQAKK